MKIRIKCEKCGRKVDRTKRDRGFFRTACLNHRGEWKRFQDPRICGVVICKCGQAYDGMILPVPRKAKPVKL